jgi:phosphoglycolate phosphatase
MSAIKAVLFDLDGTLLDTAPDLAAALNIQLAIHQYPGVHYEKIRPIASHGSKALVKLGFKIEENHPNFARLRQEYLNIYSEHSCNFTDLFPGMAEVLTQLEKKQIAWGIVTNKPAWLTMPILKNLNLIDKTNCVVCGDTLSVTKPDPAPLLYACEVLQRKSAECIYIGDAEFDIIAGKRAGIKTILAGYGYISEEDNIDAWQIDGMVNSPLEILDLL